VALKGSVSRRYAKALLAIAREKNRTDETGAELGRVAGFFNANPELFMQLLSPTLTVSDRAKVIDQMAKSLSLSPETSGFLQLVNRKGRLEYLGKMHEAYQTLSDQAAGTARAKVLSARVIPELQQKMLVAALEKRLNKKVMAQFETAPELIGGVKVQVGGLLLDGSVQAQLKRMQEELERI